MSAPSNEHSRLFALRGFLQNRWQDERSVTDITCWSRNGLKASFVEAAHSATLWFDRTTADLHLNRRSCPLGNDCTNHSIIGTCGEMHISLMVGSLTIRYRKQQRGKATHCVLFYHPSWCRARRPPIKQATAKNMHKTICADTTTYHSVWRSQSAPSIKRLLYAFGLHNLLNHLFNHGLFDHAFNCEVMPLWTSLRYEHLICRNESKHLSEIMRKQRSETQQQRSD